MSRTGGRILVDQLALHGADLAFGVPGESYIDILDALRDSPIRYVTCRHEAGAANMRWVNLLGWSALAIGNLQLIAPADETVLAAGLAWERG